MLLLFVLTYCMPVLCDEHDGITLSDICTEWEQYQCDLQKGVLLELSSHIIPAGGREIVAKHLVKYNNGCFIHKRSDPTGNVTVLLQNGYYECLLVRNATSGKYAVGRLIRMDPSGRLSGGRNQRLVLGFLGMTIAPHWLYESQLLPVLRDSTALKAHSIFYNNGSPVLAFQSSDNLRHDFFPMQGKVTLNAQAPYFPEHMDVMCTFYPDNLSTNVEKCVVNLRTSQTAKRCTFKIDGESFNSTTGIQTGSWVWEGKGEKTAHLADSEFTLSAFGLEEPFGVEWPQPTPWWLYLAGGTVFFFVLALLFGAAIRKFNARAAG